MTVVVVVVPGRVVCLVLPLRSKGLIKAVTNSNTNTNKVITKERKRRVRLLSRQVGQVITGGR